MTRHTAASYEFGAFRLDPLARVLSLRDRPIALAPKSFDLLRLMVEHPGRVLERDELIRALWPDTIVEEANLTFQVSTLRKALGEDGSKWIETVPKHGYRFMATVREVPMREPVRDVPPLDETPLPAIKTPAIKTPAIETLAIEAPAVETPRRPAIAMVLTLAAALAVILAAVGWLRRDASPARAGASESSVAAAAIVSPLTTYPGWEGCPTMSPDGSQVAFAWDGSANDNLDIYLKLVGPGEPHRLTTDPGADFSPAWSPDGRQIAFLREVIDSDRVGIYLMPALGGAERRLAEIDLTEWRRSVPGVLLAWSPDGKWLAAAGRFSPDAPSEIWLLSPDTGDRRRLTTAGDGLIGDFGVSFSPDGRFLALLRFATRSVGDVYLLPLDAGAGYAPRGPLVRVTHEDRLVGGPSWGAKGDRIFYSSGGALSYRTLRMVAFDPAHPERRADPVPLPAGEQATTLASARDRLIYARLQRDTNIWRLPLQGAAASTPPAVPAGAVAAAGKPELLIASTLDDHNPDFSPDGKRIAFASTRSGSEEIWVANVDGSAATQMTSVGGPNTSNARWSPDGRTILFNSRRSGSSDLYLLDVATHGIRRLTDDATDEYEARWSRDGKWIYFVSTRSGRAEVWKMPAPADAAGGAAGGGTVGRDSGAAVQVTRQGGGAAFESADGRAIYYAKDTRPRLSIWRVAVEGGEETQVVEGVSYSFNFAVTARGLYQLASRDQAASIEFFDFATRKTMVLHALDRPSWFGFALAPDERSVLFSQVDSRSSDLMLLENLR